VTGVVAPVDVLAQLVRQLAQSQWARPGAIAASQHRQLRRLARHCAAHSVQFAQRLASAGLTADDLEGTAGFARLPVLTRRDLQSAPEHVHCRAVPPGHDRVGDARTSGSTGEPVIVRRTAMTTLFWHAMVMRELEWHARDLTGRLCTVRPDAGSRSVRPSWGNPADLFAATGPRLVVPVTTDAAQLAEWLADFKASLLVIYPNTLDALTVFCRRGGITLPDLRQILTMSETLSPRIRAAAAATFNAAVADCYSSEEVGHLALQCPVSGLYHVMAEKLLVEVLADDGSPCSAGEIGRVVVTDLHNFATPVIRYAIGDFAEVAAPCPCGRGLPTWRRIVGRERNLVVMPDGTRHWPITGFPRCRDVAPVVQYQLIQYDRDSIEARLVVERPLSRLEEERLCALFHNAIGHPFAMRFAYVQGRIPPGPSGKYEEFVCALPGDWPTLSASSRQHTDSRTSPRSA